MPRAEPTPSWPTREQELLLRAALWRGPEGLGAWEQWRARARLDALDGDSQWLLPALYENLRAQDVAPRLLVRYRNVYLHNWYRNNLTLHRAQPALARLEGVSGAVVLLGGGALALAHYATLGARPFERLSVLAPGASVPTEAGPGTRDVDVRASLLDPGADEELVRRATVVRWQATRHLVLDPADQVLDLCLRRREWDHRSGLLWMCDAVMVARRHPGLDWRQVMALAGRLDRRREVARALGYLRDRLGLGLPDTVMRESVAPAAAGSA